MEATRRIFNVVFLCYLSAKVYSQINIVEDISKLSRANTIFATELYKQLSRDSTNLIFSPVSISVALSMLNVGTSGTTYQELNNTLGFTLAQVNEQELLQGYQNLVTSLTEEREGYQFSLANAQFLQKDVPFYSNYTTSIAQDFHASIRAVDFGNAVTTLAEINDWVKTATNDQITSILPEVSPLDVLASLNAVYFKGQWLHSFEETDTTEVDFFTADGTRKRVNMMVQFHSAKHGSPHGFGGTVLELPFKENLFSMIFILPELGSSLAELEERLTPENVMQITQDLQLRNLTIGIPKLNIQNEIDLIPHLQAMGIRDVFTNSADFSRMTTSNLKVTKALHKATVELAEDGTEASAATALTISNSGWSFWVNRPFMFLLRHNPTSTVCFMGKVTDV